MSVTELSQLLEQARVARAHKEYEAALSRYGGLLERTQEAAATDAIVKEIRLTAFQERGRLLEQMGRLEDALGAAEAYYLEAGSNDHAVEALVMIGELQASMGRHKRSQDAFTEALELAEAFNFTFGRAKALLGAGLTLHRRGRSEDGIANLTKALALFEQMGDRLGRRRAHNHLGITFAQVGAVDKAIAAFEESLALSSEDERERAIILGNLGECFQMLLNMEQALTYHSDALARAESTQLRSVEADASRNLGFTLCSLGRLDEGIPYLERALSISEETKQRDIKMQSLYSLALAQVQCKDAAQARLYAEELYEIAEARRFRLYQANALHALGLVHELDGEIEKAEQRWQEAIFLAHETGRQALLWKLHAALANIAANPGLARVHYQIAADIINTIAYPIEDEVVRGAFLNAVPVKAILDRVS